MQTREREREGERKREREREREKEKKTPCLAGVYFPFYPRGSSLARWRARGRGREREREKERKREREKRLCYYRPRCDPLIARAEIDHCPATALNLVRFPTEGGCNNRGGVCALLRSLHAGIQEDTKACLTWERERAEAQQQLSTGACMRPAREVLADICMRGCGSGSLLLLACS